MKKKMRYYVKAYLFCLRNKLGLVDSGPVFVTNRFGLPISYNQAVSLIQKMR